MKKVIICLVCLFGVLAASAQTEKGFRAMVDAGYTISTSNLEVSGYGYHETFDISDRLMFTATGGYQICSPLFVGVGVGAQYWYNSDNNTLAIPIFADVRYDLRTSSRWGFFADARVGYTVIDIDGFYFTPYVGVRYGLSEKLGLNLGLGYEMQKCNGIDGSCNGIAIKFGVDF